jgi:hypothetical protein
LPMTVIGNRKMPRYLTAFNLLPEIWGIPSPTDWTMTHVICRYFSTLREQLYPTGPRGVLLDILFAHRAVAAKETAESLEYIPLKNSGLFHLSRLDARLPGRKSPNVPSSCPRTTVWAPLSNGAVS